MIKLDPCPKCQATAPDVKVRLGPSPTIPIMVGCSKCFLVIYVVIRPGEERRAYVLRLAEMWNTRTVNREQALKDAIVDALMREYLTNEWPSTAFDALDALRDYQKQLSVKVSAEDLLADPEASPSYPTASELLQFQPLPKPLSKDGLRACFENYFNGGADFTTNAHGNYVDFVTGMVWGGFVAAYNLAFEHITSNVSDCSMGEKREESQA